MTALALALGQPFSKTRGGGASLPDPVLSSLSPNTAVEDILANVTVNGTGFTVSSVVYADATPLATVFVSSIQLTTSFTPTTPATIQFTVHNDVVVSNQLPFIVTSGGFSPTDIAGLQAWWDASDAATFTYSSGTEVSQWNDKSVNARHLAQATVSQQPSRSGVQNSLPTISFTKANGDHLFTANFSQTAPFTLFLAIRRVNNYHNIIGKADGTTPPTLTYDTATTYISMGHFQISAAGNAADWLPAVYCLLANSGACQWRRNGVVVTGADLGPNANIGMVNIMRIGTSSSYYFGNFVYELILYGGAKTAPQIVQVEDYLKAKWGT